MVKVTPTTTSNPNVEMITLDDDPEEAPPLQSKLSYPRTLAERSSFLREPKDGKKAAKVTAFQWKVSRKFLLAEFPFRK